MSTSHLILIHINISKVIWENDTHTQQKTEKNIVVILHIYGDRENFLLIYDDLKIEPNQREIKMSILYKMGEKYFGNYSYLCS